MGWFSKKKSFEEEFGSAVQQLAVSLIKGLPDGWKSAELHVVARPGEEGPQLELSLVGPPGTPKAAGAPDDVAAAATELVLVCQRHEQPWPCLDLKVAEGEDGDWSTEIEIQEHLGEDDAQGTSPGADIAPEHISPKFRRLLTRHAGMALDKRATLNDALGDEFPWEFDMETGKLTLAETHQYRAYVLGSVSAVSNTWLWAWANQKSQIPESVLKAAASLRQFGQKEGIPELTEPTIPLERVSVLHLALVGCSLCKADLFYLGGYENGAVLLLAVAPELRERAVSHTARTSRIVAEIATELRSAVDHRECITCYLKDKGYVVQDDGAALRAAAPTGDALTATFDAEGRLGNVQAEMTAADG